MTRRVRCVPTIVCAWWIAGCQPPSSDEPTSTDGGTEPGDTTGDPTADTTGDPTATTGDPTTSPMACGDANEVPPAYDPPGECYNNAGCTSCNCVSWRDNPPDPMAVCGDATSDGSLRVTATVFEFPTDTVLGSVSVEVFNAFDVGVMGIDNAVAVAMTTADADGRIDLSIMPNDSIGMVAIIRADGFRATATGLAKPPYEPSNAIHDLFVVSDTLLASYSDALAADAALADFLPLGDAGGVVGIVRNRYTGEPFAGARIVSLTNGEATGALVRYLADDGTFGSDATGASGVYVLLDPALAEEFEATVDGAVVSTRANKAGSGAPGVFTMNLTADIDPGSNPFE